MDELQVLRVGEKLERGELKVLPLLVDLANLAIDVLLDLLGLLVELDELALADGLVVGVNTSAAADDIVDGVDAIMRRVDEAVLGSRMATRDGLAGDLFVTRRLDRERRPVHLVQGHDTRGVVHDGRWR